MPLGNWAARSGSQVLSRSLVESTPSSWSWKSMAEVIIFVLLPIWKGESGWIGSQMVTSETPVDLR